MLNKFGNFLKKNELLKLKIIHHNRNNDNKKQIISCFSNDLHIIVNNNDYKNINNFKIYFDVNNGILNGNMVITNLIIYHNNNIYILHYNNIRDFTLSDNIELFETNDYENNYSNIHYISDEIRCIYEKIVN